MMKRTRISRAAVSLLTVGSLIFGATVAYAAENDVPAQAQASDRATERTVDRPAKGRFGGFILRNTMEILGVNQGQIVSTLASGGTLAELAAKQGSSGEALVESLVAIVEAHVDEAVATGRITAERGEEIVAAATEKITSAVFSQHLPGDEARRHLDGIRALLWKTMMEFLDVNRGQVVANFAKGGTLADLAVEQGSSGGELIDVLVGVVDDKLAEAVDAGNITEDRAAEMLAKANEAITNFVNSPHQPGRGTDAAA